MLCEVYKIMLLSENLIQSGFNVNNTYGGSNSFTITTSQSPITSIKFMNIYGSISDHNDCSYFHTKEEAFEKIEQYKHILHNYIVSLLPIIVDIDLSEQRVIKIKNVENII